MGTDIYGGIEYRHPHIGRDWYEGEPWLMAIDLWPLNDQTDYTAFGCLFGVRNYAGFTPIAAGCGLPTDLSSALRADLEPWVTAGQMSQATWVTWGELNAVDPSATPDHFVGRVTWSAKDLPSRQTRHLVPTQWPPEVLDATGPPPPGWNPAVPHMTWTTRGLDCLYESLAVGVVLGADTHWPHVFAVMRALAGRFGDEGVRLVVAFD